MAQGADIKLISGNSYDAAGVQAQVSGVFGDHSLQNVNGWENYTTAIGGSVEVRLGHAQGVPSLDHNTVSIDEPLRLGRFIGVWLRTPPFFDDQVRKYFLYFFQDKVLEVSGLQDNEIDTMSRTMGSVKREESYAGAYKENNGKFTIKVPEVKGSPVRKILKYYMSGISDPVTGTAHFHGRTDLRFSKVNYGGDFMYILLGPTMRPDDIEFACIWFNAFPTIDQIQHLNSGAIGEYGDAGLTFDINFNGTYVQNDEVNLLAMKITEAFGLYKDTMEDVVLPSYIYQTISDADLAGKLGVDIATRLKAAQNSNAQNTTVTDDVSNIVTGRSDDAAGYVSNFQVGASDTSNTVGSVSVSPTQAGQ